MDKRNRNVCWGSVIEEVLIEIFSKLDSDSLITVASVCHSWRCVAHYPECWDCVHLFNREKFLDNNIKETIMPVDRYRLFRESDYMIRHVGDRAKSICVHPIADDTTVQMIADRCPSIESISLRECVRISPASLLYLIHTCKHLKLIDLTFCSAVSTSMIKEMGQSCPNLVGLNLSRLQVTEEMAREIGKFMRKLKWLNLNDATISSRDVCNILDSCNELNHVSLRWCRQLIMNYELRNRASSIAEFVYSPPPLPICRVPTPDLSRDPIFYPHEPFPSRII